MTAKAWLFIATSAEANAESENGADPIDHETVLGTFTQMSNVPIVRLHDVANYALSYQ